MTRKSPPATASWPLVKRLAKGYLKPHKKRLAVSIVCMLLVSAATAAITYMVKPILDEIFIARNADMLYIVPAILLGLYIVKGAAAYVQSYFMEYVGQRMVADLQTDLYTHVVHQDMVFFQKHTVGDLASRFLFDLHRLKQAVSQTITGSLRDVTMIFGLVAVMFIQDWQLALLAFTALPLVVWPISRFGRHMRRYAGGQQEETGRLSEILTESLGHMRQVKSYTMEPYEISRAKHSVDAVFRLMVKAARVRAASSPVMEFLGGLSMAAIIIYGGMRVMDGLLTTGAFFSFLAALMSLYRPIKGLTNTNNVLQEGLAAAERTFQLLDTPFSIKTSVKAPDIQIKRGKIEFKSLSLRYTDEHGEHSHALEGISFKVPPGKTIALVGASGAGKTSLLNVLPRFFDPTSGEILVDDINIRTVNLKSLRSQIALVTQDVAIFNDMVAANISYGTPGAKQADIEQAAKDAAAEDFIAQLPHGYDTILGENGTRLSGGQRQRIAIARALLKNAPILLLDEATSSLDSHSERQVQDALNRLMKGRTTLVVAHRLSTITHADKIYVLENGRIAESGTHIELLTNHGPYAKLWELQAQGKKAA